jgi:hypothetical protein
VALKAVEVPGLGQSVFRRGVGHAGDGSRPARSTRFLTDAG